MAKVKYSNDSNYKITRVTDNKYLGIYVPPVDVDDYLTTEYVITPKYNHRPDLMAYDLYGNAKLWWVFAHFNPDTLIDPIIDFKEGMTVVVPREFS